MMVDVMVDVMVGVMVDVTATVVEIGMIEDSLENPDLNLTIFALTAEIQDIGKYF